MNSTVQSKAPYKAWLFLGILLAMGPVFGMAGTIFGMTGAFYHLKTTGGQMADPADLAETVSWSMYSTVIGVAICPIGIGLIIFAVMKMRKIDQAAKQLPG